MREPQKLIVTTVTVTNIGLDYLFLYQATECQTDFVIHAEGVAFDAEAGACLQGAEVQAECAVVSSCNGDVLAGEDARVALYGPGQRLRERVVLVVVELVNVHVAAQDALVRLLHLHDAVAAEVGLQVTAKNRVLIHI